MFYDDAGESVSVGGRTGGDTNKEKNLSTRKICQGGITTINQFAELFVLSQIQSDQQRREGERDETMRHSLRYASITLNSLRCSGDVGISHVL